MLVKHNSKGQTPISKIKPNNRAYTNKAEIADQFNKHVVNVGQNLAKRIENCDGSPTQFIRSTPVASFVMSCVTETQVCSLLKGLNDHKSSLDIPNKFIKIAAQPLVSSVCHIISLKKNGSPVF